MEITQVCGCYIGLIKANLGTERKSYIKGKSITEVIQKALAETPKEIMPVMPITFKESCLKS